MLKIVGSFLLIGTSSAIGFYLRHRLAARVHALRRLENGFSMMETEICFLQTPLLQAIGKIADTVQDDIFYAFKKGMTEGMTPLAAMRKALSEAGGCLTTPDKDILMYGAQMLGGSDVQSQKSNILSLLRRLSEQRKTAAYILQTNGRLYPAAGVLGGLLAVLLLL